MRHRPKLLGALTALAVLCALGTSTVALGQETSGALQGLVTMRSDKSPLPGVAVEAVHIPTGTHYTAITGASGRFTIMNIRVGTPYTVSAKIPGFKTQTQKDIEIRLGDRRSLAFELDLEGVAQSVEVTGEAMPLISPDRMGSGSAVPEAEIKVLPTIRRQFQDFAKTNPYVNVSASDSTQTSISVGGKNNRYNTIQIDGAVNNDLFGLAPTGTPGGQTDTQPISLDAIQELQVVVSPYDVKQGGFTGGAINAITRSGSNDFHGSVYGSTRNEKYISSKVPQVSGDALDKPYATFKSDQYGARIGGPILKDQLFFFGAAEGNRLSTPTSGSADGSTSNTYNNPALAAQFQQALINRWGYNPGGLGDYNVRTNSDLLFGRLDFNASASTNITARYNYVNALQDVYGSRNSSTYTFEGGGYTITDKTNSGVVQVNSVFGADAFNQGRVGYQTIKDNRVVPTNFPTVYICGSNNQNSACTGSGAFTLLAGTERSSGGNSLDQKVLEVTDDFTLVQGNHTITVGTHNEFFRFKNLFIQDITGTYFFNSVAQFDVANPIATRYQVKFANGADPYRATQFGAQQWGLYAGDQWRVSDRLSVNFGIRADLPRLTDNPSFNPLVYNTFGIDTSTVPNNNLMISPRLGFNWAPSASGKDQVRGGVGVFAGRTPFVWISNAYGGTGIEITGLSSTNVPFNGDPNNPPKNFAPGTSAISVDTVDPNFKFPQILRSNLAYDRELPFGIRGTVEFMFTKTLEDVMYYNKNKVESGTTTPWGGPIYKNSSASFSDVTYLTNTSRGEQQNLIVQLEKRFPFGLYFSGSYAYMKSKTAFDATSSVAYSNWQFETTNGNIYTEQLTRSLYEVPNRFQAVVSQAFKTGPLNHNVAFIWTAQSGQPYSILMGGDANKDGGTSNDLLFVPYAYSDVVWKAGSSGAAPTEAEWNDFISRAGLDKYRGRVVDRNSSDAPWIHSLDFHYDITLPIKVVDVQLTFDVLNLFNLIDSNSGLIRYVPNQTFTAVSYGGVDAATGKPIYTVSAASIADNKQYSTADLRSRYQLKLGARLSF